MAVLPKRYRFGPFELIPRTRELYKHGTKLKLRPQAFRVLEVLAERCGDVVTREELQGLLWASGTFVDSEHGINNAVKELRGVLSDSASEPAYIETLPRLGYRMIATVETIGAEIPDAEQPPLEIQQKTESVPQARLPWIRNLRTWQGIVALAVLVAAATAYVLWWQHNGRSHASGRVVLAVLPFENLTGDPGQDYFSDGFTEEMISRLGAANPEHVSVIARGSVMHYKNSGESLEKIGSALKVQYMLEGSVRREGDRVRVTAELVDLKGQRFWFREYERESSHMLSLQQEIAEEISGEIWDALGGPKTKASAKLIETTPAQAQSYDLYLKGMYFWNERNPKALARAIDYFEKAVADDPGNARAYAALANCYALINGYAGTPGTQAMPKARAAALRALEIDGSLPEAHAALALVAQNYDWDWTRAESEYRRAIELNPNYATGHHWYAEHLAFQGRFDEALAESERARQLDPLSLIIATDNGAILYYARRYDDAIQKFEAVEELDPFFVPEGFIIYAEARVQRYDDALETMRKRRQVYGASAWDLAQQALVLGAAGRRAEAEAAMRDLKKLSRQRAIDPAVFVMANVGVGDREQLFVSLDAAYREHSSALLGLKVDPMYDPFRSDPRFQQVLRGIHLDK